MDILAEIPINKFISALMQYCDKLIIPVCGSAHYTTKVFYREKDEIGFQTLNSISIQGDDWSCGYFCYPFALLVKKKTPKEIAQFSTLSYMNQKLEILSLFGFRKTEINADKSFGEQISRANT